jgi:hypothetical protein
MAGSAGFKQLKLYRQVRESGNIVTLDGGWESGRREKSQPISQKVL